MFGSNSKIKSNLFIFTFEHFTQIQDNIFRHILKYSQNFVENDSNEFKYNMSIFYILLFVSYITQQRCRDGPKRHTNMKFVSIIDYAIPKKLIFLKFPR